MPVSSVGEIVEVPVPDGSMRTYLARPATRGGAAGHGEYPTVIVIQEAFGVNFNIQTIGRRLAGEGFFTAAPVLYHRKGVNPTAKYGDMDKVKELREGLTNDLMAQDLAALVRWLQPHAHAEAEHIGIVGFCMGGSVSFLAAVKVPDIKASAVFYGGSIVNPPAEGGTPLIEQASAVQCPVIGFFGGQDRGIPKEHVDKIEEALKQAGKDVEMRFYPDAQHGFMCDERESYNEAAAKDAWEKMVTFFKERLR